MNIFSMTQFNIGDYLQIIFRRKWLFIIPFTTIFLTATIGSFFLPKVYRATSLLLVEEKQLLQPLVRGMAVAPTIRERLNILKEQITSWYRLEEMVKELGLAKHIRSQKKLDLLIQSLRKRIDVRLIGRHIIRISFEDTDPRITQLVVNYITKSFVQENISGQEEEANAAINFIKDQLEIYRKKLEDSEAALRAFKEKYLLELPGSAGSNLGKAMGLRDALLQIDLDLQEAQRTKQMLQRQLSDEEKVIISKTTTTNPIVQQLNSKLIELQTQLSELKAKKCTDEHPWVVALKDSIEKIKQRIQEESASKINTTEVTETNPIYQEIESKLRDTETLIDSLMARKKQLQKLAAMYEKRARSVPKQEQELTRLTRDMGVNESIYAMLLNRLETANISQRLERAERGTRFKIIDPARFPLHPVRPNKKMIAFIAFVIGSILGLGCVFLGEYTDHSLRSLEDAETILGIPSLGSISKIITIEDIKTNRKKRKRIIILASIISIVILIFGLFVFFLIKG
jgi:polysaccharide chain length determinant protein (PEP-CTERM system associated)